MNRKSLLIASAAAFIGISLFALFSFRPPQDPANQGSAPTIYEYMQFSTVESVVPGGLGRSRILTTDNQGQMTEKDLKNFYSMVGINFGNIANNDRAIVDRINQYAAEGWELVHVTTGSHEQMSQGSSSGGLFFTRYLFRRAK